MTLPKATPQELIDGLRELAHDSFVDTFPDIPEGETVEADAADFIQAVVRFLEEIVAGGGPLAERAAALLRRQE